MTTIPDRPRRKHILGIAIITVMILLVLGQLKHLVIEHTYCEGEVPIPGQQIKQTKPVNMEGTPDVVMLGTSWCPSCAAAIQFFAANDINYCEYDMETSAIGARLYKEVNGRGVPILFIGRHQIHGFSEATVTRSLQEAGLL
jgi:glutaredoxin